MDLTLQSVGPVVRHLDRHPTDTEESRRDRHRRENAACTAGLRGAAGVVKKMPHLIDSSRAFLDALLAARQADASLRDLHLAGGPAPLRQPPSPTSVTEARRRAAAALGLTASEAEASHPASPWKFEFFRGLATLMQDPDRSISDWLHHGPPHGFDSTYLSGRAFS